MCVTLWLYDKCTHINFCNYKVFIVQCSTQAQIIISIAWSATALTKENSETGNTT